MVVEEHLLSRMVDSSMVFDYNTRSAQNPGKEVVVVELRISSKAIGGYIHR